MVIRRRLPEYATPSRNNTNRTNRQNDDHSIHREGHPRHRFSSMFLMLVLGIMIGNILLPSAILYTSNLQFFNNDTYQIKSKNNNNNNQILRGGGGTNTNYNYMVENTSYHHPTITTSLSSLQRSVLNPSSSTEKQQEDEPNTNNNNNYEETELLSSAQERFIQDQKLLSSQSIPTRTTPTVMKTPKLPDSKRLKILVTGGAGFVGSHLVDKLMMEGHEVFVVDNFFTGSKKNIEHWLHHPNFSLFQHDVIEPIMMEVDQIYHLACPASPPHYQYNPVKTIKTSTMGTINMLGLAKRVKARILLSSTSEVYGDPEVHPQPESYWGHVNPIGPRACYDEGKRVAETMMYSYRDQAFVDVRVARIFNTFGPRMHPNDGRVVSNFIIQALQNKPLTIYGDGTQTRSFQYVSDLVDGLYALMNGNYDGPVNIGNPDEYSVRNFAEYIKELTESNSEILFLEASKDDPTQRRPDITVAREQIGWEPKVKVEDGLLKAIEYFRSVLTNEGDIIPTGPGAAKPKGFSTYKE